MAQGWPIQEETGFLPMRYSVLERVFWSVFHPSEKRVVVCSRMFKPDGETLRYSDVQTEGGFLFHSPKGVGTGWPVKR